MSISLQGKNLFFSFLFNRIFGFLRCSQSVDFSLQCAWLLDAYITEQMKLARKPNVAIQLLFDILYEKYKPKISYISTTFNNIDNHHHRLDEEENENGINLDDEIKSERALSQDNLMPPMMKKKGHQKSRSDVSGKGLSMIVLLIDQKHMISRTRIPS